MFRLISQNMNQSLKSGKSDKSAVKTIGIIPARYASTRFPAKSLADIDGKSMIQRVYEQAKKSAKLSYIVVATDHVDIYNHVVSFGGNACMTSQHHASGTDRCFEALTKQHEVFDYVINIQGDEPFIAPEQIDLLLSLLDGETELATLVKRIEDTEQLFYSNEVKTIVNKNGEAIYFSRAAIPHLRNVPEKDWLNSFTFLKHIGLYGYRVDILEQITKMEVSSLEKAESLEQLRWIENGFRIKVAETTIETIGIDTPEDVLRAIAYLKST
jgi:3-deoxy-manno-octulosonate cytidylyltransferase (CMP-KDO synthetase)